MRNLGSRAGIVAAMISLGTLGAIADAQAQISTGKKEIERAARLAWLDMKRHQPRDPNERVQAYVECVANSIIDTLEEKDDFEWEVIVFDNPQINAAVDPLGKIAVFNGILSVADTQDALAAVLGHEIAHATGKHVLSRARRGLGLDVAGILVGAAVPQVSTSDIDTGFDIYSFKFDREQESEADSIGLRYMANAGFDPMAAIYLWKRMAEAMEGKDKPAEFMSSHPSDDRRLDAIVRGITPNLIAYNEARDAGRRPNCVSPVRPQR